MSATRLSPERRSSGRVRPLMPLRALLAVEAQVLSLSPRGMSLRLEFPPDPGSRHHFSVVVGEETVEATGVIRSAAPDPAGAGYRVGVEFLDLGPGDLAVLESFVAAKIRA